MSAQGNWRAPDVKHLLDISGLALALFQACPWNLRTSAPEAPEPGQSGQRWRLIDDPVAIRALAHPLRHDLMAIIGRLGRATTADAARELGISHGLASHHLRQLAKYGFVEQVDGQGPQGTAVAAGRYVLRMDADANATAEGTGRGRHAGADPGRRGVLDDFLAWQQRRKDWPQAWDDTGGDGQLTVYLTRDETAGLAEAINELLLRYVNERPIDDVASWPAWVRAGGTSRCSPCPEQTRHREEG